MSGSPPGTIDLDVYIVPVSIVVMMLIFLALLMEVLTDKVERLLYKRAKHLLIMFRKMYKQLMILGLCSFFLVVEQDGRFVSSLVKDVQIERRLFDFIHATLFVSMLVYACIVLFLMLVNVNVSRVWRSYETLDPTLVRFDWEGMEERMRGMNVITSTLNVSLMHQWRVARDKKRFHDLRVKFIMDNSLSDRFDFSRYLRICMRKLVVQLVEVHWSVWLAFVVLLSLVLIRKVAGLNLTNTDIAVEFVVSGYVMMLLNLIVWWKCEQILSRVVSKRSGLLVHQDSFLEAGTMGSSSAANPWGSSTDEEEYRRFDSTYGVYKNMDYDSGLPSGSSASAYDSTTSGFATDYDSGEMEQGREGRGRSNSTGSKWWSCLVPGDGGSSRGSSRSSGQGADKNPQKRMFWFASPILIVRFMQFQLVLQTVYIPLNFTHFYNVYADPGANVLYNFLVLIPFIVCVFVVTPMLLPVLTISTSVGDLFQKDAVQQVLQKQPEEMEHYSRDDRHNVW